MAQSRGQSEEVVIAAVVADLDIIGVVMRVVRGMLFGQLSDVLKE